MKPANPVRLEPSRPQKGGRLTLDELFAPFPPAGDVPECEPVHAEDVPPPFDGLLVHEHHMTVTVEAYHGDLVDVRILACSHKGPIYTRKIVLPLHRSGKVVLFGIVRVNLDYTSAPVRAAIVEGKTPFGRVLIEHNVMRRIEPTGYMKVRPGPAQLAWFGLTKPVPMYGRLAFIYCDEKPAVELLEIVVA
jgi:chorismate-pyruvate lyase